MKREAAALGAWLRGEESRLIELIRAGIDQKGFLELASVHQVNALCSFLWRTRFLSIPEDVARRMEPILEDLRRSYLHHFMRNDRLRKDLTELVAAFEEKGINSLFLKGSWVAFAAYPDPGTRHIADIDLCIQEEDFEPVVEVLTGLGYASKDPLPRGAGRALRQSLYGNQLFFSARARRPVELHFQVLNYGLAGQDEEWIWEGSRGFDVGGGEIRVPGPVPMLLHLVLHANQHGFCPLRLLLDLHWTLLSGGFDSGTWREFIERVSRLRCRSVAYHSLMICEELFGTPVPEDCLDALRPGWIKRATYSAWWRLGSVRRHRPLQRTMTANRVMLYLLEMSSLRNKVRYLSELTREAGGARGALSLLWSLYSSSRRDGDEMRMKSLSVQQKHEAIP